MITGRSIPLNGKTKQIVTAALFAALACVATMVIKIPSPMDGYLNLGDCVVLAAGWLLAPGYGFLAAGLGSGLADLFRGMPPMRPQRLPSRGSWRSSPFTASRRSARRPAA